MVKNSRVYEEVQLELPERVVFRFPKDAEAIYIANEYGLAFPMKRSSKNPRYYYYHEKYFEYGYVRLGLKATMRLAGKLIFRDGRVVNAEPVKIVCTAPTAPWNRFIVYIVRVRDNYMAISTSKEESE